MSVDASDHLLSVLFYKSPSIPKIVSEKNSPNGFM